MELVRDVPLGVRLADLKLGEIDAAAVRKLFDFLEFRTLHTRLAEVLGDALGNDAGPDREVLEPSVTVCATAAQATELFDGLAAAADSTDAPLALATPGEGTAGRAGRGARRSHLQGGVRARGAAGGPTGSRFAALPA